MPKFPPFIYIISIAVLVIVVAVFVPMDAALETIELATEWVVVVGAALVTLLLAIVKLWGMLRDALGGDARVYNVRSHKRIFWIGD